MKLYNMWSFLSDLFHSADFSRFIYVVVYSVSWSFSWQSNILPCRYTIHLLMSTSFTFGFCDLRVLWALIYKFFCWHIFVICLGVYLGVEFLHSVLPLFAYLLENCQTVFKNSCATLHSHCQCMGLSISSHSLQH